MPITIIGRKSTVPTPQKMNILYKYTKYLLSVIINLGTIISVGDTVSHDGIKQADLGKRAPVLTCLYGRMIFDPFEICFHEGFIWR